MHATPRPAGEAVLPAVIGGALGVSVGVGFARLKVGPLEPVVSAGSIVVSDRGDE